MNSTIVSMTTAVSRATSGCFSIKSRDSSRISRIKTKASVMTLEKRCEQSHDRKIQLCLSLMKSTIFSYDIIFFFSFLLFFLMLASQRVHYAIFQETMIDPHTHTHTHQKKIQAINFYCFLVSKKLGR